MNRKHDASHVQNQTQAQEQGQKTYYGPACKYQHDGLRYTKSGICVSCARTKGRASYKSKPEIERQALSQKNWQRQHGNTAYRLWHYARNRAIRLHREFTITKEDIIIPDVCPVLGIAMDCPSLDRFDNNKGYTPENVRIISKRANILKNDGKIEEFEAILRYMRQSSPI